jgi:hypothetical protein
MLNRKADPATPGSPVSRLQKYPLNYAKRVFGRRKGACTLQSTPLKLPERGFGKPILK